MYFGAGAAPIGHAFKQREMKGTTCTASKARDTERRRQGIVEMETAEKHKISPGCDNRKL